MTNVNFFMEKFQRRASVAVTSSIIKNLQKVEEELREVVIALGLSEYPGL